MQEDKNVEDTNIDLVIKGENHANDFSLEQLINRKSKEGLKDIEAEIIRLKSDLVGNNIKLNKDYLKIVEEIRALRVLQNGLKYKNSL